VKINFDESTRQAELRHERQRIDGKIRHAKWAARKYAATLALQAAPKIEFNTTYVATVMTAYAVHPMLREFAAKECRAILAKKGRI